MQGAQFGSFDDLKETLRRKFQISDDNEFQIKFVNEDGSLMELSGVNWDQIRELSQTNQIQLAIELLNQDNDGEEEDGSGDYDDNDFEEEPAPEKVFKDPVTHSSVKMTFDELRIILQIKKIKRGDALKYILHGVKDPNTRKKIKKVSIECLVKQLSTRIGLTRDRSLKMAKFLIE